MKRDLLQQPLFRGEDLGKALPDSDHANSVCLPRWQDVIGYEEGDPAVVDKLQCGYPRFVFHPLVEKAFARFKPEHAECCHIYTTQQAAERCCAYLLSKHPGADVFVFEIENSPIPGGVAFPEELADTAKQFWQHAGEGISSRCAQIMLNDAKKVCYCSTPRETVIKRIADLVGVESSQVFLFPSGMAAIYAAYRAAQTAREGGSVQYSFPYLDTLKLLQRFGENTHFFPVDGPDDARSLEKLLRSSTISSLFCEFPTNPLLHCVDLEWLCEVTRESGVTMILDDTVGSYANVDLIGHTDLLVTSLTKYFTGSGDVMGGAVVINPESPNADGLRSIIDKEYEPECLCSCNMGAIEQASRDYLTRITAANQTAELLCEYLIEHPKVDQVYYPKLTGREVYDRYRREDGGYGGLFSFVLKDAAEVTEKFYDNLELCKGPNLGTYFTLCCPFTMLAHYDELDFAEACGASRYLIRISTGLEGFETLKARLEKALDDI